MRTARSTNDTVMTYSKGLFSFCSKNNECKTGNCKFSSCRLPETGGPCNPLSFEYLCPGNQKCDLFQNRCVPMSVPTSKGLCFDDFDCSSSQYCSAGTCRQKAAVGQSCEYNRMCLGDGLCSSKICRKPCIFESDCPGNFMCSHDYQTSVCVPKGFVIPREPIVPVPKPKPTFEPKKFTLPPPPKTTGTTSPFKKSSGGFLGDYTIAIVCGALLLVVVIIVALVIMKARKKAARGVEAPQTVYQYQPQGDGYLHPNVMPPQPPSYHQTSAN